MSVVPESHAVLLRKAVAVVEDKGIAAGLLPFVERLYGRAYDSRLRHRTAEDNRPEHELVVLRNTLQICWRSGFERGSGEPFNRNELRVAAATALLHDLHFIPRVTEEKVRQAERQGDAAGAARLQEQKRQQRAEHMRGGAQDALEILRSLPGLMTEAECRQCVGYISLHDLWKLGWPYPASSDWLAVCCLEGDALWPLDIEFGPLADLERKGILHPTREQLREQAKSNLETQLCAYRGNFAATAERFQDGETIIRTLEGAKILADQRAYWRI